MQTDGKIKFSHGLLVHENLFLYKIPFIFQQEGLVWIGSRS